MPAPADDPFLCVVRGNPTPEEVAALVIVFMARDDETGTRPAPSRTAWADPGHVLHRRTYRGPRSAVAPSPVPG